MKQSNETNKGYKIVGLTITKIPGCDWYKITVHGDGGEKVDLAFPDMASCHTDTERLMKLMVEPQ